MSKLFTYPAKRMKKLQDAYSKLTPYLADCVSIEQIVYSTHDEWSELRRGLVRTKSAPENPLTREEWKPISRQRKLVTMWQQQPTPSKKPKKSKMPKEKRKARKAFGGNDGGAAATTSEGAAIRVAFEAVGNAVQSEGPVGCPLGGDTEGSDVGQGGNVLPGLNLSDQNDGGVAEGSDMPLDGSSLEDALDIGMDAWATDMLQTNRCDNAIRDALDADFQAALHIIAMEGVIVDDYANIQDQEEQRVPSLAEPLVGGKRNAPDDGKVVQKTKRARPLVRVPTVPVVQWPVTSAPVRTVRTLACVPSAVATKASEWTKLCKDPLNSR